MTLGELLAGREDAIVTGDRSLVLAGLAYDSRRVRAGELFFALPGQRHDGRAFARAAIASGARAVVVAAGAHSEAEPPLGEELRAAGVTVVEVPEPRLALARAAARWHGEPSLALEVVAVTGTNGKTTTTYMAQAILAAAGRPAGRIGTTGYALGGEVRPAPFTTPEAPELQGLLAEMVRGGVRAVALEASSHALVQRRCFGLAVDVAVFTNLSHDHLDYHGTLERYLDAKLMLFDGRNGPNPKQPVAVLNADDPAFGEVRDAARAGGMELVSYGVSEGAAVRIERVEPGPHGLALTLAEGGARHRVRLPLLGRYNASNAAAAFAAARALGVSGSDAARGLERTPAVPGRLEPVTWEGPFQVVVDYAHTPDALGRALASMREHTGGRLLLVFGCGGDRDRAKRPAMGRAAALGSDRAWVTSDNPRGEAPEAIAREIVAGSPRPLPVELDRRRAIGLALAEARAGDTVLIAGKGHETTQTIGDRVLPFDDREVARALLGAGREDG